MSGKVASFLLSLALIAWQVLDIVKGKAGVLTWVLLGIFSLGALFELGAICEGSHPAGDAKSAVTKDAEAAANVQAA